MGSVGSVSKLYRRRRETYRFRQIKLPGIDNENGFVNGRKKRSAGNRSPTIELLVAEQPGGGRHRQVG